MENHDLESKTAVIRAARDEGHTVTEAQWKRWLLRGLLPERSLKRHLGRGKGTETWYPKGTGRQLIALCRWLEYDRRLDVVEWCLWSEGYAVRNSMREVLQRVLEQAEQSLRFQIEAFDAEEENAIGDSADDAGHGLNLAWLGRRIGSDALPTLLYLAGQGFLGELQNADATDEVWEIVAHTIRAGMGQTWGEDARRLFEDEVGKISADEVRDYVPQMFESIAIPKARAWLVESTDEDLEAIRKSARRRFIVWAPERAQHEPLPPRLFLMSLGLHLAKIDIGRVVDALLSGPEGVIIGQALMDVLLNDSVKSTTHSRRRP